MTPKTYQIAVLAFCMLWPLTTIAQTSTDDEYSVRFSQCMDASGGVTVNMLNCIADEAAIQDARLNTAYRDVGSELSEQRRKALLAVVSTLQQGAHWPK